MITIRTYSTSSYNTAVNQKFNGELFSDRIWKNKSDMIGKLKKSIIDCMKGNTTIDKIGKDIENTFNVSAYESKRLCITELTRIQSQASVDIATNTGVKKHMWSATLDTKVCDECAALDGKVFDLNDDTAPEMPLHPLDRCLWVNLPPGEDDWKPTKRKDNETKEIISYQDYKTWLSNKGVE